MHRVTIGAARAVDRGRELREAGCRNRRTRTRQPAMTLDDSLRLVADLLAARIRDKGLEAPAVTAGTRLLGGDLPIDSLDLATVVVELEERTGRDPFRDGFVTFQTAGELAALYADPAG